ncbi:uncharacterized protein C53C9.2-like [Drosophila obscura]|uniref:uncharacterized protein C53C9.2-like n=1 Tax=Drosophila obscura TaxID=7282 RepID=UPI001BB26FB8|nr:uncharacterized protein C53C9.2-like [Drosophila obscura]
MSGMRPFPWNNRCPIPDCEIEFEELEQWKEEEEEQQQQVEMEELEEELQEELQEELEGEDEDENHFPRFPHAYR